MKTAKGGHGRRRSVPSVASAGPAWKRWLAILLFTGGGGAAAIWGIYDIATWVSALHRGDGVIETESVALGLPILGGSLCALGPLCLVTQSLYEGRETLFERVAIVLLGAMFIGILLAPLGALVIDGTMAFEEYHACQVHGRGRLTFVTWVSAARACS